MGYRRTRKARRGGFPEWPSNFIVILRKNLEHGILETGNPGLRETILNLLMRRVRRHLWAT